MKRIIIMVLALFFLLPLMAGAQTIPHVSDLAGVLNASEEADLQAMAQEVYDSAKFDIILHTTNDSQRKGPMDYSFDFYHAFRDPVLYPDGAMFSILFDTRDFYEAARGTGIELLTYREANDLENLVGDTLTDGNYYQAMRDYVRYARRIVIPPTPFERSVELLPFVLIGGLVVGLVYAFILKGKLNIAKFESGAAAYVLPNSLNLTQSDDIFLYQTVTRTKIQTSSGSGSGGGGFSSGSRGGTSYGGRGGKF